MSLAKLNTETIPCDLARSTHWLRHKSLNFDDKHELARSTRPSKIQMNTKPQINTRVKFSKYNPRTH